MSRDKYPLLGGRQAVRERGGGGGRGEAGVGGGEGRGGERGAGVEGPGQERNCLYAEAHQVRSLR